MIELNVKMCNYKYAIKKICMKATTHPQADQHVQYTECRKSNIIKLLASA